MAAISDWGTLQASFNAPSLFSTRRLIEVRLPGGKPGKDGAEAIAEFCANPPPDVILLITAGEWSKAHHGKWTDAVAKAGVVAIAWAVKPHELTGWIESRLRAKGVRADREAVRILAERVEGNLLAAAQEIDKLVLLAEGETLDAARMQSLVANAARYDVFRLTDAMLDGQAAQAARMLSGLRAEGDVVAGLMPMVVKELLRTAALARGAGARRQSGCGNEKPGHLGEQTSPVQARPAAPRQSRALGPFSQPKPRASTASPKAAPTATPGWRWNA